MNPNYITFEQSLFQMDYYKTFGKRSFFFADIAKPDFLSKVFMIKVGKYRYVSKIGPQIKNHSVCNCMDIPRQPAGSKLTPRLSFQDQTQCTPDMHPRSDFITIKLIQEGFDEEDFPVNYSDIISKLKFNIARHLHLVLERSVFVMDNIELTEDYDYLNAFNLGITDGTRLIVKTNQNLNYNMWFSRGFFFVLYVKSDNFLTEKNRLKQMIAGRNSFYPTAYYPEITDADMSNFLSSLYILISYVNNNNSLIERIVQKFSTLLELYGLSELAECEAGFSLQLKLFQISCPGDDVYNTILTASIYELIAQIKTKSKCDNMKSVLSESNVFFDILYSTDPVGFINWDHAKKNVYRQKIFYVYENTDVIKMIPPLLTMNNEHLVSVYIKHDKNNFRQSLILYHPLINTEKSYNPEVLKLPKDINNKLCEEAILLLVDTNGSMSQFSDFKEHRIERANAQSQAKELHYELWNNMLRDNFYEDFSIASLTDTRELRNAVIWFITNPSFVDWTKNSKSILKQIVSFEKNIEDPNIIALISKYRHIFYQLLNEASVTISKLVFSRVIPPFLVSELHPSIESIGSVKIILDKNEISYSYGVDSNIWDLIHYFYLFHKLELDTYSFVTDDSGIIDDRKKKLSEIHGSMFILKKYIANPVDFVEIKIIHAKMQKESIVRVPKYTPLKRLIYSHSEIKYDRVIVLTDVKKQETDIFDERVLPWDYNFQYNNETIYLFDKFERFTDIPFTSKLDVAKNLMLRFVEQSLAYGFPIEFGLVNSNNTNYLSHEIKPNYELIDSSVLELQKNRGNNLYNSISNSINHLLKWKQDDAENKRGARLRIVYLTDGKHSSLSNIEKSELRERLLDNDIILDCICLDEGGKNEWLSTLVSDTRGYINKSTCMKSAYEFIQLETMISSNNRKMDSDYDNKNIPPRYPIGWSTISHVPIHMSKNKQGSSNSVLRQLTHCMKNPHPNIDIYILEENTDFWKAVIRAPSNTLYSGGTFVLDIHFPQYYPLEPPEIRFFTPIKHCNVNHYGRICLPILDRNYLNTCCMKEILDIVYQMFSNPDIFNAINTDLACLFYTNKIQYEILIRQSVGTHATQDRDEWKKILM